MGSTDPEFATKADDQAANPLQAIQAIDAALKQLLTTVQL